MFHTQVPSTTASTFGPLLKVDPKRISGEYWSTDGTTVSFKDLSGNVIISGTSAAVAVSTLNASNNVTGNAITSSAGTSLNNTVAPPAAGSATAFIQIGSTAGFGIYFGSGAPTVTAAQGSLYMRTDGSSTSTRMYINTTGSTTWTAVTTAA